LSLSKPAATLAPALQVQVSNPIIKQEIASLGLDMMEEHHLLDQRSQ